LRRTREIKDREKIKENYFKKSLKETETFEKEKLEKASSKMVKMLFTMRQGLK